MSAPQILFAGGGAAGHFFPGIAVASRLEGMLPEASLTFGGPGTAREKHAVRSAGYEYVTIPSQAVPHNPLQALRFVTHNLAGYWASKWMLGEKKGTLVVGLGGYSSTAMVRAAAVRGIPYILLEQNAIPSRTTRWYGPGAAKVCVGWEETRPHLSVHTPVAVTGNPVRLPFERLTARLENAAKTDGGNLRPFPQEEISRQKRMVILGGAGGARTLNESMPTALKQMAGSLADWQIVHQTGEGQLQETESRYRQLGVEALAVTYIDEIASVLFDSDLVICRSSGTTMAELSLAGAPAVLVPFPLASDDHQIANAKVAAAAGASRVINEAGLSGSLATALAREIAPLLVDDQVLREMGLNMQGLARPDASSEIAAVIRDTVRGVGQKSMAA